MQVTKLTFPRTITLIDGDIELYDKEVNSLREIYNEIKWAYEANKERSEVYAVCNHFQYFENGKNLTIQKW